MSYSTHHLNYLSKEFLDGVDTNIKDSELSSFDLSKFKWKKIKGISRSWSETDTRNLLQNDELRYRTEDILTACYGSQAPVAFYLKGNKKGIELYIGVFSESPDKAAENLSQLLTAQYPGVELTTENVLPISNDTLGGVLTGVPSSKKSDDLNPTTQMDRLIKAMFGKEWGYLVISSPLKHDVSKAFYHTVLNEMRQVEDAEQAKHRRSPIAETYYERLKHLSDGYLKGLSSGLWTSSVYFFADEQEVLNCLAASLTSCLGGEESYPERIRATQVSNFKSMASKLAVISRKTSAAPGSFSYPFDFQTCVNSTQLSKMIHLPRLEVPGFYIKESHRFDLVSHVPKDSERLKLGVVRNQTQLLPIDYEISLNSLNKHALLVGTTGSGKTNTSFHLLKQAAEKNVPFLVLEPAKKEYRALLSVDSFKNKLKVFTLGNESVSPFRINPFEVPEGVPLSTHIDLLKSVFNASFGLWNPLPQILERSLYEVYGDFGWDTITGSNMRLKDSSTAKENKAFPTLTALVDKVAEVIDSLGYDGRITSDIKAALLTRLNALRVGGKGLMLDTNASFSVEELLKSSVIVELEDIGDDDEKAFMMGLLMVRIYEYLRSKGPAKGNQLKHLVVIEEAHRLLSEAATNSMPEFSNSKGKAVEIFTNMLSEIRAYGTGFLIADQVPTKLAKDVIKNTNLKIAHRIVSEEDRSVLGSSMNLAVEKSSALSILNTGEAITFALGDDRPVSVKVPYAKVEKPVGMENNADSDAVVKKHMKDTLENIPGYDSSKLDNYLDATKRRVVNHQEFKECFSSFTLSLGLGSKKSIANRWTLLRDYIFRLLPQNRISEDAVLSILKYKVKTEVSTLGRKYSWSYDTNVKLQKNFEKIVEYFSKNIKTDDVSLVSIEPQIDQFKKTYSAAVKRVFSPFPHCVKACKDGTCKFRFFVQQHLKSPVLSEQFNSEFALASKDRKWSSLKAVNIASIQIGDEFLDKESLRSIALCFAGQKIYEKKDLIDSGKRVSTETLINDFDKKD